MGLLPYGTLVDESFAHSFFLQVNGLQSESDAREWIAENEARNAIGFASPDENNLLQFADYDDEEEIPSGSVFIMTLNGPVMPETSWGIPGLDLLSAQLQWALDKEEISAIVFRLETGGGSAYKLFNFCDELLEAREKKPIICRFTGLNASAGVAISTHCTETYGDHPSSRVGSIGAALSFMDMIPWFEKEGCKYHYINAPQNPDKNKVISDIRKGDYSTAQDHLSELAADFHQRVRTQRKKIDASALTGKVFNAVKGEQLGIIDGLATLEMAVSRAYNLATQKQAI